MSGIGLWLKSDEREKLRAFLSTRSKINQLSRYVFKVDGKTVDFSSAVSLPERPKDFNFIKRFIFGWLGNQVWALKIQVDKQKAVLNELIKRLS